MKIGTFQQIYMIKQELFFKFLYKDTYVSHKHIKVIKLNIADLQLGKVLFIQAFDKFKTG